MKNYLKPFLLLILFSLIVTSCGEKETDANQTVKNVPTTQSDTAADLTKLEPETYSLGKDYEQLPKPYVTENNQQVVVYEFFGYTCPHCFTFEPFISKWLENKPDYVKFVRVPLNFQPGWADFQQAYLTAEVMGITEETHLKMFEALHNEHKRFKSMDEIAQWYEDITDIEKEVFISTADSFILDSKIRKADSMGFNMQITSTPVLIINGKYRFAKNKTRDEHMKILDFLIEKEAKEMGLAE